MSDLTLTDKISETITSSFKKTKVFEKIERTHFIVGAFVVVSTIIGITGIYINYSNSKAIKEIQDSNDDKIDTIHTTIETKHNDYINKLIKVETMLCENLKIIHGLLEAENKRVISPVKKYIVKDTSVSPFVPIKNVDEWNNIELNKLKDDFKDTEDDELINECYDSMPLNNIKKTTGLGWIFKK